MQVYYQNLGRMIRGEWWLCKDTLSLAEYKEDLAKTENSELNVIVDHLTLTNWLCYDYFGFAAKR
jgi:hypothetical protein